MKVTMMIMKVFYQTIRKPKSLLYFVYLAAMKNLNLTTTGFEASQSNSAQPNLSSLISSSASSSQNKSQTSSIVSSNPERYHKENWNLKNISF